MCFSKFAYMPTLISEMPHTRSERQPVSVTVCLLVFANMTWLFESCWGSSSYLHDCVARVFTKWAIPSSTWLVFFSYMIWLLLSVYHEYPMFLALCILPKALCQEMTMMFGSFMVMLNLITCLRWNLPDLLIMEHILSLSLSLINALGWPLKTM